MAQQFRTNSNSQHYPLRPTKGVSESAFREGDKNILGTPSRQYSKATPSSEIAHAKTQYRFLKSINRRLVSSKLAEENRSDEARNAEKKREKSERNYEADKNLELANKFMERQEKLRRGENPPPVDVVVNVESGPALPKNLSDKEKQTVANQQAKDTKKEEKIIKNITEPPQPEKPSSPAMANTTEDKSSAHTEEAYAYAASPAYTTQGEEPPKPKQQQKPQQKKGGLSLSQIALMRYPARG